MAGGDMADKVVIEFQRNSVNAADASIDALTLAISWCREGSRRDELQRIKG